MNGPEIEALAAGSSAREFWRKALACDPVEVPFFGQVAPYEAHDWGAPLRKAFAKHAPEAEREVEAARALYFGVYETTDRHGLSAKVLYVAGVDTEAPRFTSRNLRWKPRWGKLQPKVLQAIARIEDGIDPRRKVNPPRQTTSTLGQSTFVVADYDATNPGLFSAELDGKQKQYLNYQLTLVAALTVVLDFLPSLRHDRPVFAGFDEGDILRLR
jgi:hypothetical protein